MKLFEILRYFAMDPFKPAHIDDIAMAIFPRRVDKRLRDDVKKLLVELVCLDWSIMSHESNWTAINVDFYQLDKKDCRIIECYSKDSWDDRQELTPANMAKQALI